jgi:peptide chain release factor 1
MDFIQRLEELEQKFKTLEQDLSTPEVYSDREKFKKLSKTQAELRTIVDNFREYKKLIREIQDNQSLLETKDREIAELAKAELQTQEQKKSELEAKLKELMVPPDPDDSKNAILEIRAGTGGEEAALFARDLIEMYIKWLEPRGSRSPRSTITPRTWAG